MASFLLTLLTCFKIDVDKEMIYMIMFLDLRKQLVKLINQLNKKQISIKKAKQVLVTMQGNKFNYPIFLCFGSSRRDIINLTKDDILTNLQSAVDYIDKNNKS